MEREQGSSPQLEFPVALGNVSEGQEERGVGGDLGPGKRSTLVWRHGGSMMERREHD